MTLLEIILVGIGLSMDAFAVSICKGLSMKKIEMKNIIIVGTYFGVFQAIMPLTGYLLGTTFSELVISIDHWIAFILLTTIGSKMLKEAYCNNDEDENDNLDFKTMIVLAIATSIDALAIGITFAFFEINIIKAISIIGFLTFTISSVGVIIGNKFGHKFQGKAEVIGGIILIIIGIKILIEHLEIF
ncbi:MAG: manganese efflux pump [Clostridia bacterium]|nr:manganese efflux pump [Clostridia bacterium]MBR4261689.1 manganese efflux pump [Clostridia bacterium]